MLLADARSRLRVDLSDVDVDSEMLTDDTLNRSIQRAVSDLSRFLPRDRIYEVTLIFTVTNEAWISAAAAGTYITLAHKPIERNSETVKNAAGTICARDTDYYMDYTSGKITHISGEDIGEGESCIISYKRSSITVDISSIVDDLIRIERVEYPVGDIPQSFVPFRVFEDLLTVESEALSSQSSMTEKRHLVVYYKSKHTGPSVSAEGSYPNFLDDTVILAASAYGIFSLSIKYTSQTITDLASARVALGNMAAIHTLLDAALDKVATEVATAGAALDKVATYLEDNTDEDAKSWLTKVTTDIASLRTAIVAALDAANSYADSVAADLTSAAGNLTTGTAKINTVNVGDRVPERYGEYAIAMVGVANARVTAALNFAREADTRLSNLRSYIEQAAGWNRIADSFVSEAIQRLGGATAYMNEASERASEIDRYIGEADRYAGLATQNLALADRFKAEAIERRNEAWAIWRDAPQYAPMYSSISVRQTSE